MIDYLARKEILHDAFFKKYAAKKFMKASIIVREWIQSEYREEEIRFDEKVQVKQVEQENTPEDDMENDNENDNEVSEPDDFMYANELEEHEV